MIKAVVFDIGMVLVDFRWRGYLEDLNVSEEDIRTIGENTVQADIWKQMDLGARPESELIEEMKQKIPGLEEVCESMFRDEAELVRPYPGNREWLSRLKSLGLKIYLLSNYPKTMFEKHWNNFFDFTDLVDGKVVSSYVVQMKPDHSIYKTLLERYALKPEECVFLDDRPENTLAAAELGFFTVTVSDRASAEKRLDEILALQGALK